MLPISSLFTAIQPIYRSVLIYAEPKTLHTTKPMELQAQTDKESGQNSLKPGV